MQEERKMTEINNPRNENPDPKNMPHIYMHGSCGLPAKYVIVDPVSSKKACPMCFHRAVDLAMTKYPEVMIGVSHTNDGLCQIPSA